MDELLDALYKGDKEAVNRLACDLFITKDGRCNWANISVFQAYAPCRIFALERDSCGWLIGGINYNGTIYSFG